MEATVIPMICGLVKGAVDEAVGDIEDAIAEYVLAAGVLWVGVLVEVIGSVVEVLLMLIVLDQLKVCVVVGFEATRTMLGIELSTISVAVIVAWVFGRAFACPAHILNAPSTTDSVDGEYFHVV